MPRSEFSTAFYESLQALCLGTITPAQHAELERLLAENPEARQAYYDFLDVDQGLAELSASLPGSPQPAASPAPLPPVSPLRRRAAPLRYAALVALSVLATLGVEWMVRGRAPWSPAPVEQRITVASPVPQFVATLVRSTDCEWEDRQSPFFEGKRLLSSELRLTRGVAEFRFDTGVRLVLEGPVHMTIDSARAATLAYGKVVLHGHELAAEFALKTPQGTLYDVGTEYGAIVDENANVELHVFEGTVRVQHDGPTGDESDDARVFGAGDARRLTTSAIEEVPLRPDQFQREVPGQRDVARLSRDGLMAYDGFLRTKDPKGDKSWQAGGTGWNGIWRSQVGEETPSRALRADDQSLEFPEHRDPQRDGAVHLFPQRPIACRILSRPVRLDTDAIYYVSFYISKEADIQRGTTQYGSLSLRTGNWLRDGRRLLFGMTSERLPLLSHNKWNQSVPPALEVGTAYFVVAKIVAGKSTPDQVMMRVFAKGAAIPDQEPLNWTCVSEPAYDDTVFDHVLLYVEGTDYAFDEIRVASSWQAVTNFQWPTP